MTGQTHWFEILLIFGGGAAIAGYIWYSVRAESLVLRQRLNFTCPVIRTRVHATLLQELRSEQYTDIKRCSGWRHFWEPCEKTCLAPLNEGAIGEERLRMPRQSQVGSVKQVRP